MRVEYTPWARADLLPTEREAIEARPQVPGRLMVLAEKPSGPFSVRVTTPGGRSVVFNGYGRAYDAAASGIGRLEAGVSDYDAGVAS
jgi:hypothetical protein